MTDALIVDAVRSPIGRKNGTLSKIRGDELSAQVVNALVERNGVDPAEVEDVQWGCVSQVNEQAWNIGRNVPLTAGWPVSVAGTTVDRQCGSSMQTNFNAATAIMAGQLDLVVSGGVEMMSRVPMGSNNGSMSDKVHDRFQIVMQGISSDLIADKWELSREDLDALLVRVAPARRPRDRRGPLREGDRSGRSDEPARRLPLRHRRGGAPRVDAREDGRAAGGLHARGEDDRGQLVADRRRRGRGAGRVGGRGVASSG